MKPPEFSVPAISESEFKFTIHSNFVLDCLVTGSPTPKVHWFKNGKEITNPSYFSADRMHLRIINASIENSAEYICVIENIAGKTYRTFKTNYEPFWTEFGKWTKCSAKCDKGIKKRYRTCQRPAHSTKQCAGRNVEVQSCMIRPCHRSSWLPWSEWSSCSRTCGRGQMFRHRECDGHCVGPNVEIVECFRVSCEDDSNVTYREKYLPLPLTTKTTLSSKQKTNRRIIRPFGTSKPIHSNRHRNKAGKSQQRPKDVNRIRP